MATEQEIIASLKTDWLPSDKYNFEDLNRVETATEIVKNKLGLSRGEVYDLVFVKDRTEMSFEFADSLNRIESNIQQLTASFPNSGEIQPLKTNWTYNQPFDFTDANRLEQNLAFMYKNIEANLSNLPYCGQYIVGQEGVF